MGIGMVSHDGIAMSKHLIRQDAMQVEGDHDRNFFAEDLASFRQ